MTKVDENMAQAKKMLETMVERDYELQKEVWEWRSKCYELEEENKKLKSDLEECECSMHFENDEVWYRKRECKKLEEELKYYKEKSEFLNKVIVKYQEKD